MVVGSARHSIVSLSLDMSLSLRLPLHPAPSPYQYKYETLLVVARSLSSPPTPLSEDFRKSTVSCPGSTISLNIRRKMGIRIGELLSKGVGYMADRSEWILVPLSLCPLTGVDRSALVSSGGSTYYLRGCWCNQQDRPTIFSAK
jgi:hypothetical protein